MGSSESERRDAVERVVAYVARFAPLGENERSLIHQLTRVESYAKGTVLLASGQKAHESWLVIEGCVRGYHEQAGDERTVSFHTELQPVIPPTYGTEAPSPIAFECLEDVLATASTPEEEQRAFAEHPEFEAVCRRMGEALFAGLQQAQLDLVTRNAEERYLDLVATRPELLQRVPQYHVASFLGIQPETLSRIRRRLVRRGNARR